MNESKISSTIENRLLTIKIHGKFDFNLHTSFNRAYKDKEYNVIVVDFSSVTSMDSSALGMLLLLNGTTGNKLINRVKLIKANKTIIDILKIANFQRMFDIEGE